MYTETVEIQKHSMQVYVLCTLLSSLPEGV